MNSSVPIEYVTQVVRTYCNCKKNQCLKKYCVCYKYGVACKPGMCNCAEGCENHATKVVNAEGDTPKRKREVEKNVPMTPPSKKKTVVAVVMVPSPPPPPPKKSDVFFDIIDSASFELLPTDEKELSFI